MFEKRTEFTRRRFLRDVVLTGMGAGAASLLHAEDTSKAGMKTTIIFEPHIPAALRRALTYAGKNGYVASLPQLLHARVKADYDELVWNTWFTANTEESVVTTPQGNTVVLIVHGGGIFGSSPDRFERSLYADMHRANPEGLTGQTAAKISVDEAHALLSGRLPDGAQIPIYPFAEFEQGIADLPMRYGIVLDFEKARQSKRGFEEFEKLKSDPNMISRAGGVDANAAYLDKFRDRHGTRLMGHWHPYNRIDPLQAQTRIVFLAGNRGGVGSEGKNEGLGWGYDAEYGIGGDASMVGMARYVAVAPRDSAVDVDSFQEVAASASSGGASDNDLKPQTAQVIFNSYATIALQQANAFAGEYGFVASMPALLRARAITGYDNIIWNTWFTANSDEYVVTTPQGNQMIVILHGGGILSSPQRIERALRADLNRHNTEGLTGQYAVKISAQEAKDLLNGRSADGAEFPVYSYREFRCGISNLPLRYAVTLDFDAAQKAIDDYSGFDQLRDDPLMILRAGGVQPLSDYLDKARARHDTDRMGNWHPYDAINPIEPQARRLRLSGNRGGRGSDGRNVGLGWGYDSDFGMTAGGVIGLARYVAVNPATEATSLDEIIFEL